MWIIVFLFPSSISTTFQLHRNPGKDHIHLVWPLHYTYSPWIWDMLRHHTGIHLIYQDKNLCQFFSFCHKMLADIICVSPACAYVSDLDPPMWTDPLRAVVGLVRAVWLSAVAGVCLSCTETKLWLRSEHVKGCLDEPLTLVKETVERSHPTTVSLSSLFIISPAGVSFIACDHPSGLIRSNAPWDGKNIFSVCGPWRLTICMLIAF